MKSYATSILLFFLSLLPLRSDTPSFFVGVYVVPHPDNPVLDVRLEFFDADDGESLGGVTKHISGSKFLKETVTPHKNTKRIRIKFEPLNFKDYKVKPAEATVELSPFMQAKTVTWIASVAEDKAYLDNKTAGSLLTAKDADEAIARATYAGAVATTANQRLEAARVETTAYLAKKDPYGAVLVFEKVVREGFETADPSKKKVFLGEWLDVLEVAAKAEGAKEDKKTGLIFSSLSRDSKLRESFDRFTEAFAKVVPGYTERVSQLELHGAAPNQLDIAAKEGIIRIELSRIIAHLSRS